MSNHKKSTEEIEQSLYRFQEKYQIKKTEEVYGIIGKFHIDEEDISTVINKNEEKNLH